MHSNSILTRNLLDIIFENRNKDYGAYVLRKEYNTRLVTSLITVLALVILFSLWQALTTKNLEAEVSGIRIPDILVSAVKHFEIIEPKKLIHSGLKTGKNLNNKPVIVKNTKVEPIVPASLSLFISTTENNNTEPAPFEPQATGGTGTGEKQIIAIAKSLNPAISIDVPEISPEILPQYPGGMSELIKFLKQNLQTPGEIEQGEEIVVKIKFTVTFKGDLAGFQLVETGGESFDNEVMRVLKKMPKWIPGKTRGKNVSAYFIIPVKFTVSD